MFTVYVLFSPEYQKIYVGYTSDLKNRLLSHNELSKKGWTARFRPWKLVFSEEYPEKKQAMEREKNLKGAKGREEIWKIIRGSPDGQA